MVPQEGVIFVFLCLGGMARIVSYRVSRRYVQVTGCTQDGTGLGIFGVYGFYRGCARCWHLGKGYDSAKEGTIRSL